MTNREKLSSYFDYLKKERYLFKNTTNTAQIELLSKIDDFINDISSKFNLIELNTLYMFIIGYIELEHHLKMQKSKIVN